jgi:hypothetical protein
MRRIAQVSTVSLGLALAIAFGMSVTADMQQTERKPDQTSQKETGRGTGADPNIKSDVGENEKGKEGQPPGPEWKTGEKPRGQGLCVVLFDNYTRLWVKVYVDGSYAGTIRPLGELATYAVAGPTVLYARADYRGGGFDSWGPARVSCTTSFVWRLNP